MSRAAEGPRLWLKPADRGRPAVWVIKDGNARVSTGCPEPDRREAERVLAEYVLASHKPQQAGKTDLHETLVADILNAYLQDVAPKHKRPHETIRRVMQISASFGGKKLGEMNGQLFRDYAKRRGADAAARRELEDFRAAVSHYFADEMIPPKINVPMPDKGQARERWLTHDEAALLLRLAWRNAIKMPKGGKRYMSRHIARFILVGLYTGSRASRICSATITPVEGRSYVDLEAGIFYRRPPGEKITNKRAPPIRLPERLLAHMRRWARLGMCDVAVVSWEGQPVGRINQGFASLVERAKLDDVVPHTLRHTAITWAMQQGVPIYDATAYFGVSEKILRDVYGHHHPDHNKAVGEALSRRPRRRKTVWRSDSQQAA